jgi:ubiquinone/menaquinone biosynthesis C-methylase UbiE
MRCLDIAERSLATGGTVLEVGCGTGQSFMGSTRETA